MERQVVGLDRPARQELAQDVDGVLRLVHGEVRAREVVEELPEPLVVARHAREVLPGLLAVPAEECAARGLEAPARPVEELRGLFVLVVRLQRGRRGRETPRGAEQRGGLVVLLELDVERRRLLVLVRRLVRFRGRPVRAALLVERGRALRAARVLPRVSRLHEVPGALVEAGGPERLARPPPRVRGGHEIAARLGFAREELLRRLLVARARRGERGLRQRAALLEALDGLRRAAAFDEQLSGEQVLLRGAERLGGLAGPPGHAVRLARALPERRTHRTARRRLGELPARVREGAVVSEGLRDLREPVPAAARARELERLESRLLRGRRVARRQPGARRLPEPGVARVLVEAGRLGRIAVAHLERREARPRAALLEHPARAAHVAGLQVRVARADPVLRRRVSARELGVRREAASRGGSRRGRRGGRRGRSRTAASRCGRGGARRTTRRRPARRRAAPGSRGAPRRGRGSGRGERPRGTRDRGRGGGPRSAASRRSRRPAGSARSRRAARRGRRRGASRSAAPSRTGSRPATAPDRAWPCSRAPSPPRGPARAGRRARESETGGRPSRFCRPQVS